MLSFLDKFLRQQKDKSSLNEAELSLLTNYLKLPQPTKNSSLKDVELVAVDFETTGLKSSNSEIISMGFCPIHNNVIRLADCHHFVIKTRQTLSSENVAIHGLTDDHIKLGLSPDVALCKFLELTKNRVIIAHYHQIERDFIQKLARQVLGRPIPLSIIDTFWIAKQMMERRNQVITDKSLRLFNLRKNYRLPNYKAHNALEDAISTAELFLAQLASMNTSSDQIILKDLGLFNYKT